MLLTGLEMPDLESVENSFLTQHAAKLEHLSVPKLETVNGMEVDLSGSNPPPINLSFPSLKTSRDYGIDVLGNIDV